METEGKMWDNPELATLGLGGKGEKGAIYTE